MTGKFKLGTRGREEKGAAEDSGKWPDHWPVGAAGPGGRWESGTTASELAREGCSQWVVGGLHLLAMAKLECEPMRRA